MPKERLWMCWQVDYRERERERERGREKKNKKRQKGKREREEISICSLTTKAEVSLYVIFKR